MPDGAFQPREVAPSAGFADSSPAAQGSIALPWIQVAPNAPYFIDETGAPFTPIGHNDAVCWFEIDGLYRRRDMAGVEAKLRWMVDHGVTVIRVMLEYAQERHRYIEKPVGRWVPNMVAYWDDLIGLCERVGMRLLVTPSTPSGCGFTGSTIPMRR